MLRRSVVQLAYRTSGSRVPLQTTTQIPSYLSSRRAFSVSQKNGPQKPDLGSSTPEHKSRLPKILTGGLALGSVFLAAYYYGGLDSYVGEQQESISKYTRPRVTRVNDKYIETSPEQHVNDKVTELRETFPKNRLEDSDVLSSDADHAKQDTETRSDLNISEDSNRTEAEKRFQAKDAVVATPENVDRVERLDTQSSMPSDNITSKPAEESLDLKGPVLEPDVLQHKATETTPTFTSTDKIPAETEIKSVPGEQNTSEDMEKVVQVGGTQNSSSLLEDYNLRDNVEELATSPSKNLKNVTSANEDVHDGYITKDGKLVLDFLQAIHAAEERQAELDFRTFTEEKRAMKEKYEKELQDARVRELMYAEREAILDKELELEQTLKEIQIIAKAELAAAIASEKASQIEKMAEANLHINALCMAFYSRSEEARQSHSVHKLALGALALEDALSKGLPIQNEIEAVRNHLEGIDKDSLITLVLSSLPKDTQKHGTDTLSQLNHKERC